MGYVHDTQMSRFMGPEEAQFSGGTWSDAVASNVWSKNRSAADAAFTVKIPIKLAQNAAAHKGSRLVSVDIWYEALTAAMDAVAATLYKASLPASGAAFAAPAAQSCTYDAAHDTAGERVTVDEHKLTLTLSAPFWLDDDDEVYVELVCDAAATSVFKYYGARANFTLRL